MKHKNSVFCLMTTVFWFLLPPFLSLCDADAFPQINVAGIERSANDHAGDSMLLDGQQSFDIIHLGNTAGGDNR
jgi:hypothetical protein